MSVTFFSQFLTDMWWFQALGYWKVFGVQVAWLWGVRAAVGLSAGLFLFANLWLTRKSVARAMFQLPEVFPQNISWRGVRWSYALVSLVLGVLFGAAAGPSWQRIAFFVNRQPFGAVDPIFGRDVGFYVFTLPFLDLVNSLLLSLLALTTLITAAIYLLTGGFKHEGLRLSLAGRARPHLSFLLAGTMGLKAWRYGLDLYHLLYSPRGAVFGATYTDVHANALALRVLMVLAAVLAISIVANLVAKGTQVIVLGLITLAAASLVLGTVYPAAMQKFIVEPNELARETPYIANHVTMTRAAFGLSDISEREFHPTGTLSVPQVQENITTIGNIRLWDWRALLATYGQLQEFRLYYNFHDVDIDRYTIGGVYRQVMLSPRELAVENLQNPTWINQHLQYTHGYGVVASPVNTVTPEGLPEFLAYDIPPRGVPELQVTRPEIYYGEKTNQYIVVNTKTPEFDYPQGDENVTTHYQGQGGVQLANPLRRLAFAARLGTAKLLLSTDITSSSRVMFYRNIHERVRRIAPFLRYDSDPYIVISGGRLYWIQDAYTTTDRYPYSQPVAGWGNYVRNSVKVVIDAYDGDVTFYAMEDNEPLAATLNRTYGGLLRPLESMPSELRSHLRYPEDLFRIQAALYRDYHMTNTQVFYNREDTWALPQEVYGNAQKGVEPYYLIMRLPEERVEELVLMVPFTPARKDNMVAWLAARNDGDAYGKLVLFKFPKQSLTFGPAQIEARIDQDAQISQLLTLWSQKGSDVIRGNMLVIPVADALLYVEPLFLQAEQSRLPELKRVLVAESGRLAMGQTIDEALDVLLGKQIGLSQRASVPSAASRATEVTGVRRVAEVFERTEQRMRAGDWQGFGQSMAELKQAIRALQDAAL